MKASLILILLLSLPAGARTEKMEGRTARLAASSVSVHWPEGALVNVYFVRDMFSRDEKQALQETMEVWTKRPEKRGAISFVFQGETGGLIDCEHCLTIARHGVSTIGQTERVALNVLRQDESGRLLSAWIAVGRVAASPAALRNQLLQALERGLGINNSQTAKNGR